MFTLVNIKVIDFCFDFFMITATTMVKENYNQEGCGAATWQTNICFLSIFLAQRYYSRKKITQIKSNKMNQFQTRIECFEFFDLLFHSKMLKCRNCFRDLIFKFLSIVIHFSWRRRNFTRFYPELRVSYLKLKQFYLTKFFIYFQINIWTFFMENQNKMSLVFVLLFFSLLHVSQLQNGEYMFCKLIGELVARKATLLV